MSEVVIDMSGNNTHHPLVYAAGEEWVWLPRTPHSEQLMCEMIEELPRGCFAHFLLGGLDATAHSSKFLTEEN